MFTNSLLLCEYKGLSLIGELITEVRATEFAK